MSIKNIIFDLGGVILDIDYQKTVDEFRALGFMDFDQHYTQAQQSGVFDAFETGQMSPEEFVLAMKQHLPEQVSKQQIIDAWNALLLSWSPERIALIEQLKSRYNLFLFSNTNAIHKAHFDLTYKQQIHTPRFDDLFVKTYYSHEFGRRKPHPESFLALLAEQGLQTSETLFIDDSWQHVLGARMTGLQAIHLENQTILNLQL